MFSFHRIYLAQSNLLIVCVNIFHRHVKLASQRTHDCEIARPPRPVPRCAYMFRRFVSKTCRSYNWLTRCLMLAMVSWMRASSCDSWVLFSCAT